MRLVQKPKKEKVMQYGDWFDFCNRSCTAADCGKPLVGEVPQSLIYENGNWYHEVCLLRAKRAFAGARKLAQLGYAIAVYVANRDNPR